MIRLEQVSKAYEGRPVFGGLTFTVPPGAFWVIVGPSGSGKTTLLRLIAGLEMVDEGRIWLNGEVASEPGYALSPHQRGVGLVMQAPTLWPHMTVAQNILFGLAPLARSERRRRLSWWLERLDISDLAQRYPHQLSGGQARRVSLARSLAPEPPILLLDEPLIHLDAALRDRLRELVAEHHARTQCTVLWVTHQPDEVAGLPTRTFCLEGGRLEVSDV